MLGIPVLAQIVAVFIPMVGFSIQDACSVFVVFQPLAAYLVLYTGAELSRWKRGAGRILMAWSVLYALLLIGLVLTGTTLYGLHDVLFLANVLFGWGTFTLLGWVCHRALPKERRSMAPWAMLVVFPLIPALAALLHDVPWFWIPAVAWAAAMLVFWSHATNPTSPELVAQALKGTQHLTLDTQTHPALVRAALPINNRHGLSRGSGGLGNAVLDGLLELRAEDPAAAARQLADHEGLVLSVLHAWPTATLEAGQLQWHASLPELRAKGPDLGKTLRALELDLLALQDLLSD